MLALVNPVEVFKQQFPVPLSVDQLNLSQREAVLLDEGDHLFTIINSSPLRLIC